MESRVVQIDDVIGCHLTSFILDLAKASNYLSIQRLYNIAYSIKILIFVGNEND